MASQSLGGPCELFIALQLLRSKPDEINLRDHLLRLRDHVQKTPTIPAKTTDDDRKRFDGVNHLRGLLATTNDELAHLKRQLQQLEETNTALESEKERANAEVASLQSQILEMERKQLSGLHLAADSQQDTQLASLPLVSQSCLATQQETRHMILQPLTANSQRKRRYSAAKESKEHNLRSRKVVISSSFKRGMTAATAQTDLNQSLGASTEHKRRAPGDTNSKDLDARPGKRIKPNPFQRFYGAWLELERKKRALAPAS